MLALLSFQKNVFAQAEFMPYGNLNGIRIKGQLMPFNTSIDVAGNSWLKIKSTGKELQKPKFKRTGNLQVVNTAIDSLGFVITNEDIGNGKIKLTVKCTVNQDITVKGVYLGVRLPKTIYTNSTADIKRSGPTPQSPVTVISFKGNQQDITITPGQPSAMIQPNNDTLKYIQLYFPVCESKLNKGDVFERSYFINVTGIVDEADAIMQMDTTKAGRNFMGLGGNFRLQNKTDPQVIDYCLKNLNVVWGRVEMPWHSWQPAINRDPIAAADSGFLDEHVKRSMEMAQKLYKLNIPVIVTAWAPPQWAVVGPLKYGPDKNGVWGNPLLATNMQQIYKSITDYIIYLKDHYNVEVKYFSFNESDLGINIRQTGREHADLIKGLGAYFKSKNLSTKLLLGDNSDATTYNFIYPAMNDPEALPYIGAVSFHSWRGWDTPTLQKWADAAKKLNLPLLIGEGSIDAAAWAYPAYFEEESYALEEINLYTRLIAICQPQSILQWQLTADYSPLAGGGIFGDNGPLRPTRRFWQLKQLASTPSNLYVFPLEVNNDNISCTALGNSFTGSYSFHVVNNSAARTVHLKGLPNAVKALNIYLTDSKYNIKKVKKIKVNNHEAEFKLGSRSFTTLSTN
ncbi:hypothetical protein [Mucilaginibacter sp.]|jgi:hypothetical protein|uniref:hypothetical protein n=1 Tax=Mucilaginibacter sp. TaxID=1882438 RepID=UPI003562F473